MSSLRRGHANLLCIVPILSYETAFTPLGVKSRSKNDVSILRAVDFELVFGISRTRSDGRNLRPLYIFNFLHIIHLPSSCLLKLLIE